MSPAGPADVPRLAGHQHHLREPVSARPPPGGRAGGAPDGGAPGRQSGQFRVSADTPRQGEGEGVIKKSDSWTNRIEDEFARLDL